jgi:hypothetical protein
MGVVAAQANHPETGNGFIELFLVGRQIVPKLRLKLDGPAGHSDAVKATGERQRGLRTLRLQTLILDKRQPLPISTSEGCVGCGGPSFVVSFSLCWDVLKQIVSSSQETQLGFVDGRVRPDSR